DIGTPPPNGNDEKEHVHSSSRPKHHAENVFYAEGMGNAFLYSLNYERMLSDEMSIRIGYGSVSPGNNDALSFGYTAIPATFNYFVTFNENGIMGSSKLELGAGIEYLNATGSFLGKHF